MGHFFIEYLFLQARVSTYHWSNGEYKAVILKNTTVDVCKYSGGQFSKLFIAMFLPDMIDKSNLNQPCPFSVRAFFFLYLEILFSL